MDNISDNCLIGAVNAFNKETNKIKNQLTIGMMLRYGRAYKAAEISHVIIGDEYGEGSSENMQLWSPVI
ncbi:MAG: hypothetical protein R2728_16360 [Chitinophagales bacterium]